MNKVFNINLGGYPFTIDEIAYSHLSNYLTSIHNHFRDSEGYDEITGDIEARMAELFQDQLSGRPIVTLKDVDNAIAIMGTAEDFGAAPMAESVYQEEQPQTKRKYKTGKRFFRNPDDEVVGGVCSGLAAYFGIEDPVWIRIAWIVFTISGGLGIPAYIILWIIVPKAETAGDRLSMRGEKINVSNIGKIIEEEIGDFSEKMEHFSHEISNEYSFKKKRAGATGTTGEGRRPRSFRAAIKKGISLLGLAISTVLSVFTKVWKPIFFIVGFALIIGLSVIWIMSIIGFFMSFPYANYFFAGSSFLSFLGVVNILTFIGVPLLGLIMFLSKYVFKTRVSPNFKAGMWSFWIVNIISLFAIGSYQGSQFRSDSSSTMAMDLSTINSDTIQIKVEDKPFRSSAFQFGHLRITDDKLVSRHVHLDIVKSDGDQFELIQETYARGHNESEAMKLADNIKYDIQVLNNTITFPQIIELPKGEKWRNQQIQLILKVPEGKSIHLLGEIWSITNHLDVDRDQEYPRFRGGQNWRMDSNGLVNLEFLKRSQRGEEFKYTDFDNLQIDGEMKVTIEKGPKHKITMSGKPHYLDKVEVVQLEKTLNVTFDRDHTYLRSPIRVTITMPEVKSIDTKGTDDVKVQGFTQRSLRIKHDSREELKLFSNIDSLFLFQDERSKVSLKGDGEFMEATLDKKARLDADRYNLKRAKITAGVSCKIDVAVSDSLWTKEAGGVQVNVDGAPVIIDENEQQQEN